MCLRTPRRWTPVSALVDEAGFESCCDIICKSNYFLFITHIPHCDYDNLSYLAYGRLLFGGGVSAVPMLYPKLLL